MKINVIDDKGIEKNANIITSFRLYKKKYIIYTFNEEDDSNSVRIYISELRIKPNRFSFNNILNNDEWDLIKELMREMAKGVENIEYVLSNYDVEVVNVEDLIKNNEYTLATIRDSKIVKVSPKFISGLYTTYKELLNNLKIEEEQNTTPSGIVEPTISPVVDEEKINSSISDDSAAQKMKDIWEYSSMLQKKIAKDMETLNSKVVKLDGERYYVKVKDPLYLKEKLDLKGNINDKLSPLPDEELLKELEPVNVLEGNVGVENNQSLFNQLEKELSGINDNFNKIVVKNQEKKAKLANEIEKRLQDVAAKEKEINALEEKLLKKEEELNKREEELRIANSRLEENVRALTKYANMVNSVILKKGEEED